MEGWGDGGGRTDGEMEREEMEGWLEDEGKDGEMEGGRERWRGRKGRGDGGSGAGGMSGPGVLEAEWGSTDPPPPSTALPPTASPGVIGSPLIAHTAMTPLPKKPHRVYPPIGFIPTPAPTHLSRFGWQGSAGTPLRWGGGGAVVVVFIGGGRGGTVVVVFSGAGGWGCYSVAAERKALSQGWERAPLAPEWDIWGKKKRKKN